LFAAGFMCDADTDDSDTMNKKIRNAQLAQYNFILGAHSFHSVNIVYRVPVTGTRSPRIAYRQSL